LWRRAAFGALAILFGAAALVAANPASVSLMHSVRAPGQVRSGLLRAQRPGGPIGLAAAHRAYVRRPASVARGRLAGGDLPPTGSGQAPVDGAPSTPSHPSPAPVSLPVDVSPLPPVAEPGLPPAPEPPTAPEPPPVVTPPPPSPEPAPEPEPEPAPAPILAASFEEGLSGWNIAGVGEVIPTVTTDIVRDGERSSAFVLTGEQDRSELILGGNGTRSTAGTVQFHEGDEYWYGFSFYIETMVYGEPGAHNLIMQFKSADSGSPAFGLQLWDYVGDHGEYASNPKGLWSAGTAMGGDRFLAPAPEQVWHDVAIHFRASSVGAGFYEVYLDGALVDSRGGVSMIVPGAPYAYIKDGLYRNGTEIPGTSEIRLDAAKLGDTMASVRP
jgi:polysaccharide lyase-like protein